MKAYRSKLVSRIVALQAEFQEIANRHPWICLGIPRLDQGFHPLTFGVATEPVAPDFGLPGVATPRDEHVRTVLDHMWVMTDHAHRLLYEVLDGEHSIGQEYEQQIRAADRQNHGYGWVLWLWYAAPMQHVHRLKNYAQVAATGLLVLRECIATTRAKSRRRRRPEVALAARNDAKECEPTPFSAWAIGRGEERWVLFRQIGREWRDQARVQVSKGRQNRLLEAFLAGDGLLSRQAALRSEGVREQSSDAARKAIKRVRPELTNLRNAIRDAAGIAESDADPLPPDGSRGWRAALALGYAVKSLETGRLEFKTRDQMRSA